MKNKVEKQNWPIWQILLLIVLTVVTGVGLGRTAVYAVSRAQNPRPKAVSLPTPAPERPEEAVVLERPTASKAAIMDCLELMSLQDILIGKQALQIELLKQ